MDFDARKARAMAELSSPSSDRSPKGGVDAPIIPLLDYINGSGSFFTTSSCSGRISVLAHPSSRAGKKTKAGGSGWVFVSHDPADPTAVAELLFRVAGGGCDPAEALEGDVVFRFEPLIVAVECRDPSAATALVGAAIAAGFRESGITSLQKRIMVAIRCSIRMEVPIGKIGALVVSPEYIQYLVKVANNKMAENKKRTDSLIKMLETKGLVGSANGVCNLDKKEKLTSRLSFVDAKLEHHDILCMTCEESDEASVESSDHDPLMLRHGNALQSVVADADCDLTTYDANEIGNNANSACSVEQTNYLNENRSDSIRNGNESTFIRCRMKHDSSLDYLSKVKVNCFLSGSCLKVNGEPLERLHLWGHTTCACTIRGEWKAVIFGGFGGIGRHGRRNDALILHKSGLLREIKTAILPTKRIGHSAVALDTDLYVIGGRDGPMEILDDVWCLDINESKWSEVQCGGDKFLPRHRHAATAVGSKIYVFGGVSNEGIYSCMNILDLKTRQWCTVTMEGEWPSGRHSHCMVSYGSEVIMFGGHDGQRALNDIYSFNIYSLKWKRVDTIGALPSPRFSHSMFIYDKYVGVIGGCPVTKQRPEIAFLDLHTMTWFYVSVPSLYQSLCVRHSSVLLGDELFIIGGGASCYAFGTKFSHPVKVNLNFLESIALSNSTQENSGGELYDESSCNASTKIDGTLSCTTSGSVKNKFDNSSQCNCVLLLKKIHAKAAKDIMKRFGWLDLTRKVQISQNGCHVNLPIDEKLYTLLFAMKHKLSNNVGKLNELDKYCPFSEREIAQYGAVLETILSFGGLLINDKEACAVKVSRTPQSIMRELVHSMIEKKGMPLKLLEQLPTRWDYLGDIVVLPKSSFSNPTWDLIGDELWPLVAKSLGAPRLARQGRISPNGTRDSSLELLVGNDSWVTHHENGILYSFDAAKCMFSFGNRSEKLRMAQLNCRDEIVVDLFSGIGYFVLPFLVKANAQLVYACEWNPHAIEALHRNVRDNFVADRCIILEGDNRIMAPKGVADRVCLGLLPSSECSWPTAVRSLRVEGGILHIHGNVKDSDEARWLDYVLQSIIDISNSEGLSWDVSLRHVEHVKWYAPHIRHVVADLVCKKL